VCAFSELWSMINEIEYLFSMVMKPARFEFRDRMVGVEIVVYTTPRRT
jgi:hypothetical protein